MCWTGLSEEEVQEEDEEPEAQDIRDPVMDLTRGERESLRGTVAVTERELRLITFMLRVLCSGQTGVDLGPKLYIGCHIMYK